MSSEETQSPTPQVTCVDGFAAILKNLVAEGYALVGPRVKEQAIVLDRIDSADDLPRNWKDEQGPGHYRIEESGDQKFFNFTVGPHSWKKYLHPPQLRLWQAERQGSSFKVTPEESEDTKYAFIGVRPCEIKAMQIQDKVFRSDFTETHYDKARDSAFILAVNCGRANETCFCTSTNSGPKADDGFDLSLTEFLVGDDHLFLVEVGSEKGAKALKGATTKEPSEIHLKACKQQYKETCSQMTRKLDTNNIRDDLMANLNHPRLREVEERCLSCANCTMACPTCFCTTVEDVTDLSGDHAERWRHWDSCFTQDFSYIAGGSIRTRTKSRYRQWMTHKLATWQDQFGTSGCVGCGRCIAWCPVGIDITEEASIVRDASAT